MTEAERQFEADLHRVLERAAEIFEPRVADSWMRGPNEFLGGRPIDVLRIRGVDEVLEALDVAEQKAWGG